MGSGEATVPAVRAAVAVPPATGWPDDLPPEQWPALYEAGATLQEIAERTGHTSKRVRRELWARGVKFRPRCPRPPAWHATAAEMWARGATYAEISKVVGQTRSAVRVALLRRKQRLAQAAVPEAADRHRAAARQVPACGTGERGPATGDAGRAA